MEQKNKKIYLYLSIIFGVLILIVAGYLLGKYVLEKKLRTTQTPKIQVEKPGQKTVPIEKKEEPKKEPISQSRPFREPITKEVSLGNPSRKQIALTFDAGASATQTPAILNILKENNVKSTFFITGKWAEQNPELIRKIASDGHTLGNHTYSHPYLTEISNEKIAEEFSKTESIIKSIVTNVTTKPYFRPPYGNRNQQVLDFIGGLGYQSIYWTVDALDWQEEATNESVKTRIFSNLQNGAIVLMHVGDDITPAVLQDVINRIKNESYSLVTIDELLK